ncbi:MAG: DNA double-strand break repair nuclease NurA [Desulfurococcaceae archaeon]
MKELVHLAEELKRGMYDGVKITREDQSTRPIEVLDEVPKKQIEVLEKPAIRTFEVKRVKTATGVFGLDSSSRTITSSLVFIAVSAGSIFNRFNGQGIDIPSVPAILGIEEPLCRHIVVVPEVDLGPGFATLLEKAKSITIKNPISGTYTSSYNKNFLLVELRLMIEQCLLEKFNEINNAENTVLLIDGPLIDPHRVAEESPISRENVRVYVENVNHLNSSRVRAFKRTLRKGIILAGIVKRLNKSYYLSKANPADLATGIINDEAYLTALLMSNSEIEPPLVVGPLRVRQDAEFGLNRILWYIVVPRRWYYFMSSVDHYVTYRVEVLEDYLNFEDILSYIFYDSLGTGSLLPLSILVVDRRVKKISSSLTTYLLYNMGLPQESTSQYISIL